MSGIDYTLRCESKDDSINLPIYMIYTIYMIYMIYTIYMMYMI